MITRNSIITSEQRIEMANAIYNQWQSSNTYVMIGNELPYQNLDTLIPIPNDSTDYKNAVWRNAFALKKILASNMAFVVPRSDWQSGVSYNMWDSSVDMYATSQLTKITGTANTTAGNNILTGNGTSFITQVNGGDFIYLPGDGLNNEGETKEVVQVISNTSILMNSVYQNTYVSNNVYEYHNSFPFYVNNFYVKNSYDQVFICLYNAGGAVSTVEPQLSIGGDLPTDTYVQTSDGYKWKYLYTIPPGQKLLFLSDDYMPVYSDPTVVQSAVNGRLDIFLIQSMGQGYNQNVASNTATILKVAGDGTLANLSAKVNSAGQIFGINVLNGGINYTQANVLITAGATGAGANIRPIIGPQGGHGFNPRNELGASTLQLTMTLAGTEGGTIPTGASVGAGVFQYRQIAIVQNPLLVGGNTASALNYSTVSTINVQAPPAGSFFTIDETVYQGPSLANATFIASVVYWDQSNSIIWVNDIQGTFTPSAPIVGTQQSTPVTAFFITPPIVNLFTGEILYINNIAPVTRGANQEEYIRVLLKF